MSDCLIAKDNSPCWICDKAADSVFDSFCWSVSLIRVMRHSFSVTKANSLPLPTKCCIWLNSIATRSICFPRLVLNHNNKRISMIDSAWLLIYIFIYLSSTTITSSSSLSSPFIASFFISVLMPNKSSTFVTDSWIFSKSFSVDYRIRLINKAMWINGFSLLFYLLNVLVYQAVLLASLWLVGNGRVHPTLDSIY